MDVNERVMRKRIRDKAMDGIHDIVLATLAEVIPSKKDEKIDIFKTDQLLLQHMARMMYFIQTESEDKLKLFLSIYKYEIAKKYSILTLR